ncbi:MAG: hypothetical protein OXN84_11715 [Albidovulum sp.]|nr:hypothetical protein [Albidovulum sp.]
MQESAFAFRRPDFDLMLAEPIRSRQSPTAPSIDPARIDPVHILQHVFWLDISPTLARIPGIVRLISSGRWEIEFYEN